MGTVPRAARIEAGSAPIVRNQFGALALGDLGPAAAGEFGSVDVLWAGLHCGIDSSRTWRLPGKKAGRAQAFLRQGRQDTHRAQARMPVPLNAHRQECPRSTARNGCATY